MYENVKTFKDYCFGFGSCFFITKFPNLIDRNVQLNKNKKNGKKRHLRSENINVVTQFSL